MLELLSAGARLVSFRVVVERVENVVELILLRDCHKDVDVEEDDDDVCPAVYPFLCPAKAITSDQNTTTR